MAVGIVSWFDMLVRWQGEGMGFCCVAGGCPCVISLALSGGHGSFVSDACELSGWHCAPESSCWQSKGHLVGKEKQQPPGILAWEQDFSEGRVPTPQLLAACLPGGSAFGHCVCGCQFLRTLWQITAYLISKAALKHLLLFVLFFLALSLRQS